jgi:hypothetical protein
MKQLAFKTVVEYKYDSLEEAKRHEEMMFRDGWKREAIGHIFITNFRSYSKRHNVGAYFNTDQEERK